MTERTTIKTIVDRRPALRICAQRSGISTVEAVDWAIAWAIAEFEKVTGDSEEPDPEKAIRLYNEREEEMNRYFAEVRSNLARKGVIPING